VNAPRRAPSWSLPFAPCEAHGCAHLPDSRPVKDADQFPRCVACCSDLSIFAGRDGDRFRDELRGVSVFRRSLRGAPPFVLVLRRSLRAAPDLRRLCLSTSTPATAIVGLGPCGLCSWRSPACMHLAMRSTPVLGGALVRLSTVQPPELTSRRPAPCSPCDDHGAVRRRLTVHGLAIRVHVSAGRLGDHLSAIAVGDDVTAFRRFSVGRRLRSAFASRVG
jgi:hypothetical protein